MLAKPHILTSKWRPAHRRQCHGQATVSQGARTSLEGQQSVTHSFQTVEFHARRYTTGGREELRLTHFTVEETEAQTGELRYYTPKCLLLSLLTPVSLGASVPPLSSLPPKHLAGPGLPWTHHRAHQFDSILPSERSALWPHNCTKIHMHTCIACTHTSRTEGREGGREGERRKRGREERLEEGREREIEIGSPNHKTSKPRNSARKSKSMFT